MNHSNRRRVPLLERIHKCKGKKLGEEGLNEFEVLLIDSCPRSSFRKGLKQMRNGKNIQTLAINREQDQANRKRTYRDISHLFDTLHTLPHLTTLHLLHCDHARDDVPLLTKYLLLSAPTAASATTSTLLLATLSALPENSICHQKLKEIRINANTISVELVEVLSKLPNLENLSLQAQTTPMESFSLLPLQDARSLTRLSISFMANQRYVTSPLQELICSLGNSHPVKSRLTALELRLHATDKTGILNDVRALLVDNQTLTDISISHGIWRDNDFVDTVWLTVADVLSRCPMRSSDLQTCQFSDHHSPLMTKFVLNLPQNSIPGKRAQVALLNLVKNRNYTLCDLPTLRNYHEKSKQEDDGDTTVLEQINYYLDLNARGRGWIYGRDTVGNGMRRYINHDTGAITKRRCIRGTNHPCRPISADDWVKLLLQGIDSLDWIFFVISHYPLLCNCRLNT